jgi:hypothetical protein
MHGKLGWIGFDNQIAGIEFRNSVSLEVMSRAEVERFNALGVPAQLIEDEEAKRILGLSHEDATKERMMDVASKKQREQAEKDAEEERRRIQGIKDAEAKTKVASEVEWLKTDVPPEDLKTYLENLPEGARELFPKLMDARATLVDLLQKKAGKQKVEQARKIVESISQEMDKFKVKTDETIRS